MTFLSFRRFGQICLAICSRLPQLRTRFPFRPWKESWLFSFRSVSHQFRDPLVTHAFLHQASANIWIILSKKMFGTPQALSRSPQRERLHAFSQRKMTEYSCFTPHPFSPWLIMCCKCNTQIPTNSWFRPEEVRRRDEFSPPEQP